MSNLVCVFSEAQRTFRQKLFDSVEIAEWHFCTKLKCNLPSAIEISQHKANTAFFAILDRKKVNNLLKKADIYPYHDRNGTKLRSMYKIGLLPEKKIESAAQLKRNKF